MSVVRPGRASKACDTCRKQKTRCYDSAKHGGACLRCVTLQNPCSLEVNPRRQSSPHAVQQEETSTSQITNKRLDQLERTVNSLVKRLGPLPDEGRDQDIALQQDPYAPTTETGTAPVLLIRDVATEVGADPDQGSGMQSVRQYDIIANGLITVEEATSLLELFHEHYGRWVLFEEYSQPMQLLAEVKKSPLLLCSCCLIAVRHTTQELAERLAPTLFAEAKSLLASSLLDVPTTIDWFKAVIVLSLWSTSIGQLPLSIDSWVITGFALQHCLASNMFGKILSNSARPPHLKSILDNWKVWNHLCLAHLQYCVGTRRRAMLSQAQIDRCRMILDSDRATNFETRMVAEINLYWIIYGQCCSGKVDLPSTQAILSSWRQEWAMLFDQPRSQFLQMGYNFAQLLAFGQSLKSGTAAVRESLVSEILRLSTSVLHIAMDTTDDRTRHLTDHIYHIITFSAVTLCRLLTTYEDQLQQSHDIASLDALITHLVVWLRSIGLPCHVAHTLGDIVSALHKKLRPYAVTQANSDIGDMMDSSNLASMFPDLLGSEFYDVTNGVMWPGWDSFTPTST